MLKVPKKTMPPSAPESAPPSAHASFSPPARPSAPQPLGRRSRAALTALQAAGFGGLPPPSAWLVEQLQDLTDFAAGEPLSADGIPMEGLRFIVSGWAAQVRHLADGRRQIVRLVLPGEPLTTVGIAGGAPALAVVALTALTVLDAGLLDAFIAEAPADAAAVDLSRRLAALAAREREQLVNQIVRLGRQTAPERLCSLLLELRDRLILVGQAAEDWLPMPLTQETLADATGLSLVHFNRVLRRLRDGKVLELRRGGVGIHHLEAMMAAADYSRPSTLN